MPWARAGTRSSPPRSSRYGGGGREGGKVVETVCRSCSMDEMHNCPVSSFHPSIPPSLPPSLPSCSPLQGAKKVCESLALDGLVVIGGDDSNTNAAVLGTFLLFLPPLPPSPYGSLFFLVRAPSNTPPFPPPSLCELKPDASAFLPLSLPQPSTSRPTTAPPG
jgi:hypothetical protein